METRKVKRDRGGREWWDLDLMAESGMRLGRGNGERGEFYLKIGKGRQYRGRGEVGGINNTKDVWESTENHTVLYLPKITCKCMWITCTCTPTPTPQFQSSYTTYGHNAPFKSHGLPSKTLGTKHKIHPFELLVSALSFLPEFEGKTDPIAENTIHFGHRNQTRYDPVATSLN